MNNDTTNQRGAGEPCAAGAAELHAGIDRILIPRRRIAARVRALGGRIGADFADRPLVLAAIMTGSLIFVADLIRHLPMKMRIHLTGMSSYAGPCTESGPLQVLGERGPQGQGGASAAGGGSSLAGRHVLIVDDILDSGRTLAAAVQRCRSAGAAAVRTCVLLRKPPGRRAAGGLAEVDYVGFDVPDVFVVGYGLDYDDYYRNLPDIAVLKQA